MGEYRNPVPTVDAIIELNEGSELVLVRRKNPPLGWALPGGFVEEGEPLDRAAVREAKEETGLDIVLTEQFFTYSAPDRDPRQHTISTVYLATARGVPHGADDAAEARAFPLDALPRPLCFDHEEILSDYLRYRRSGERRKI